MSLHISTNDNGSYIVDSEEELLAVLAQRDERNANEFWLTHEEQEFPMLVISVSSSFAYAHYMTTAEDMGWQSVGAGYAPPGLKLQMYFGGHWDDAFYEHLVSVESAAQAAREFLGSSKRPGAVQWRQVEEQSV